MPSGKLTKNMMKLTLVAKLLLVSFCLLASSLNYSEANQAENLLRRLIKSKRAKTAFLTQSRDVYNTPVYVGPQDGLMENDKITALPGQPNGIEFNHYSGYVTVDPQAGRALFYYFAESPLNSSTNPLVLWLNGGPGCSSLGYGAMTEIGPFRVNSDGKTLLQNDYALTKVANIIFLESPASVGFSYSNTSSDYEHIGDNTTAVDTYTFLVNWLERFPLYKTRDFFIVGESYAGHYVPQLANTILSYNQNTNQTVINLKGIAVGNGELNDLTDTYGIIDYFWSHALISDETYRGIYNYCDFKNGNFSQQCEDFVETAWHEVGYTNLNNIYAPLCHSVHVYNTQENGSPGSVNDFDPCSLEYAETYLNIPEVQTALHANHTTWYPCRNFTWNDRAFTVLPIIENIMASGVRVWIYSGDVNANMPVTSTRYSISSLNLSIHTAWYPWYTNQEVGGYAVEYEGLTFATVRGGGYMVPSYQPERALTVISSFLKGILPPSK